MRLTEAVQLVGERLAARMSATTTSCKSITHHSRKFATEPALLLLNTAP